MADQEMQLFNDGWSFLKTGLEVEPEEVYCRQDEFQPVDIPHDWQIYDGKKLYEDSCGWYKKTFEAADGIGRGERMILRFDGVYMDSAVYMNGRRMGEWKYGYSTFYVDMTPALSQGENTVFLQARFQGPNSRWYSGAGIYRNVWMKTCAPAYLVPDGVYVTQKACEGGYWLKVRTETAGDVTEDTAVRCRLWLGEDMVLDMGRTAPARVERRLPANLLSPEGTQAALWEACSEALVVKPGLWDIDDPVCYRLEVQLLLGEETRETRWITVGFRTMEFDPQEGFLLNGRKVKVHGVCEHHDFGCLGAAFHTPAMRRKFNILRRMGVNAIRTSHNMPAPELMELADEMGFLVVDEAFDMWERSKTKYDYGRFFKEWASRDVASWVRRDRNHPSLMLWSIGNEIYDTHADEHGQEITRRLIGYVREHDPCASALITIGSNYMPWENARKCADIVKIAGYNYGEKYYEEHHREHPDWVIYGSETASIVQSRGVYHFPLSQSTLADEDEQCSALGNSTTSWGARSLERCITDDRDAEFAFGQFLWTGFDYIGEPTPYHTRNSYFGQVDTAGFPKDAYYVFQSQWTDAKAHPMVHVFPYWDFNPGQLIDVRACTNASSVELFLNGRSLGRQEIDHLHGSALMGEWKVRYEPGTILAAAYDEDGREVAREERHSFGDGVKITVSPDQRILKADGEDLCFITIGEEDASGNPVENAMDYVTVEVKGPGRLLGLDNGDSTDYDEYKGCRRKLFNGKLLAVVGVTDQPGRIEVTVRGANLAPGVCEVVSEQSEALPGRSFLEDCGNRGKSVPDSCPFERDLSGEGLSVDLPVELPVKEMIPVRKVELEAQSGQTLDAGMTSVLVRARIFPENASDRELFWKAVNDAGIEIGFASVEETGIEDGYHTARVTACGDGDFRIRCMSKSGTDKVKIISQLEFTAQGLGQAFLDPYGFISAGLYTDTIGEIGNGNEKGIATARDGMSGVYYSNIDFGDYGSDEITVPVFALSDEEYPIEIWQGRPGENGAQLLMTALYQKPSRWNVYQEETWKLPVRLKGVTGISFVLRNKVHIKGFSFRKYEKAVSLLTAAECSRVYGDSFTVEEEAVTGIGNNVTLEYENMDFGEEGVNGIAIYGRTPLAVNTIHIHFTDERGELVNRIVEFKGEKSRENGDGYSGQTFLLEPLKGRGKVEFVFLPGSDFDFHSFRFLREEDLSSRV